MTQLFKKADDSFANRRNTFIVMGSKKGRGSIYPKDGLCDAD